MGMVQISAFTLLIVAVLVIVYVIARRSVLARNGGIDMCWRDRIGPGGGGWYLGVGRFDGGELKLYRSVSIVPLPQRTLHRADLTVGPRRDPVGAERELLPAEAVVLRCTVGERLFELAMPAGGVTGLLAWLESAPPSNHSTGGLRRTS